VKAVEGVLLCRGNAVIHIYSNLTAAGFRTASWWCRGTAATRHNSAVFSFWMQSTINRWDKKRCLCTGKAVAMGIVLPTPCSSAVDDSDDNNNVTATHRESGGSYGNGITLQ